MQEKSLSIVKTLRTIISIVPGKQKRKFCFLFVIALLSAGLEICIAALVALMASVFASTQGVLNNPYLLWFKKSTGYAFLDDPRLLSLFVLSAIVSVIILKNLLGIFQQWQIARFSEGVAMNSRQHLFRFYLRAPFLWILNTGTTDLLFSMNSCAYTATSLLNVLNACSNSLMLLGLCISLLVVAPVPSLIFMCSLALLGYFILKFTRRVVAHCSQRAYRADRSLHTLQQMAVHGLKEMRIYGREPALFDSYTSKLADSKKAKERQVTVLRLPISSLEVLGFLTLMVVMCYLVFVQDAGMGRISGIVGFMAAAAWRALPVANRTVDALNNLRVALPYLNNVALMIALEKKLTNELMPNFDKRDTQVGFNQELYINNITFNYPNSDESALQNVSLKIKKGQMVALVGFSGSGKTTLANLLTGLIPVEKGQLLVDGQPLNKENVSGWLSKIGYVAQSPFIFDATLAENIALSRWGEEIDRKRVLECCKMAALDFVDELKDGIDTILGERGVRFSGGEAQRVAIARALYSNPELIIFDEATSALDMRNEQAIHNMVLSLHNQVTMVIIAHRLSTVENCDHVVWLDKGQIKQQGSTADVLPAYKIALELEGAEKGE